MHSQPTGLIFSPYIFHTPIAVSTGAIDVTIEAVEDVSVSSPRLKNREQAEYAPMPVIANHSKSVLQNGFFNAKDFPSSSRNTAGTTQRTHASVYDEN